MSMRNLVGHLPNSKVTPPTQPIPGREADMVQNHAGGYVFVLDKWDRLNRFLVLGTQAGTYYASEKQHTVDNAKALIDLVQEDGLRVVRTIVEISEAGRAPKNDPAILALAVCAKMGSDETRTAAYAAVPKVCRIGTHLFQFAEAIKALGGFSSGFNRALARWYQGMAQTVGESEGGTNRHDRWLALQAVKYQAREGWSHRDLLRLSKPGAKGRRVARTPGTDAVFEWITKGTVGDNTPALIRAFEEAKTIGNGGVSKDGTKALVRLITEHGLPRECVPTAYLNEVAVWDALLFNGGHGMPMTAMIRNLGKMSAVGLLAPMSDATRRVTAALSDEEALRKARVHPLGILVALNTYRGGQGIRGSLSWSPVSQVLDALDKAFYLSFGNVESTGKRWNLALDVSGSMSSVNIAGMAGITPRIASAAMAMVTAAVEPQHVITAFSDKMVEINGISPRMRLDSVIQQLSNIPFGGTDCSLPMVWAGEKKIPIDVFVVITDNETWHSAPGSSHFWGRQTGNGHPIQALDRYQQKMGIPSKLIVIGMTSTGFTIADPSRRDCLDVVGFDLATPTIMTEFVQGRI